MSERAYLFIGGTRDGRRIVVPDGEERVALAKGGDVEFYLRQTIVGKHIDGELCVFVEKTISPHETMVMLIDGYHAPSEPAKIEQPWYCEHDDCMDSLNLRRYEPLPGDECKGAVIWLCDEHKGERKPI